MIWNPLQLVFDGVLITLLLIGAGLFFYRGHQRKDFHERLLLYGFASFFYGLAHVRIFFILGILQLSGIYINHTFYAYTSNISPNYYIFTRIALIGCAIALALFIFFFELNFKRTKYLLTVINTVLIMIMIALPFSLTWYVYNSIFYPLNALAVATMLVIFTKRSRPEFRSVSLIFLIGFILYFLGDLFTGIPQVPSIFRQLIFIAGITFCIAPAIISPDFFSRNLNYIIAIGASSTYLLMFTHIFLAIYFDLGISVIIGELLVLLIDSIFYYFIIKYVKSEEISTSKEGLPDVLGAFSKPQKLTEEEVSVSKEKKICLVCKGKVARSNIYLCPECNTFYCEKCSNALSDLENMCWVCDAPFDESKPVKPYKKEEALEEIEISEKITKTPKIDKDSH